MNNRKKKGFTLIELIVVIAILAVLGLLIVPQISGYIDATQATTCQNNRKLVERAITVAEAKSGKTETFTTPEQVAAIKDSLYDGGKICPKEGTITITGHKVTCSIHKDETSGGGFIKDGTIMDQRDGAISSDGSKEYGIVYKVTAADGKTILYYKCINSTGCNVDPPKDHIGNLPYITNGWKEIYLDYTGKNNYEYGDVIKYNGKHYKYTGSNGAYYGKVPTDSGSGFVEVQLGN